MRLMCIGLLGLLTALISGCSDQTEAERQVALKIANNERLMEAQPAPQIGFSMDRYLLKERQVRFNDPNKMTYLYTVFPDGTWLKVTIIGKMASTSKRLTSTEGWTGGDTGHYGEIPDEMGTYGSSQPDKVGMTTLGTLIEMGGFISYIYSETPLNFTGLDHTMVELQVEVTPQERTDLQTKLSQVQQEAAKQ